MTKEIIIEKIDVYHGRVPTNLRFSSGVVREFPFTFIKIKSDSFTGYGETLGSSGPYKTVARGLIGKDAARLESLLPEDLLKKENNGIREVFSICLYDLVSKVHRMPLCILLGGKRRDKVPLMPCIFSENSSEAGEKALAFVKEGYRYLKVKIMGEVECDSEIIISIRKKVGQEIYLQADANCGYKDFNKAREAIDRFKKLGLDVIEDPLLGSLEEYRALRTDGGVKIMIDVSARTLRDVGNVLLNGAADIINQHPCQQGGLERAKMVHAAATATDIPTMIGGTGFLGVGTAAFQTLSSVIGLDFPCGEICGIIDHGFPKKIVKKQYYVRDGEAEIPDEPGLGIEIDEESLESLVEEHFFEGEE
ncbi:MAG: mandelate racemase/muconate lactonizing enzyme family protein [Nitrospinae bacterium]|nr:mandelate racemase/muconate lactonizing enzyme family protein [Nitrospinota bacterium]